MESLLTFAQTTDVLYTDGVTLKSGKGVVA